MKEVVVLRHADKDPKTGLVTEAGLEDARKRGASLGSFVMVLAGDRPRLIDTAVGLTGLEPKVDDRASFVYASDAQKEALAPLARAHRFSHAGALYDNPEFEALAAQLGVNFVALIKEVLAKLPDDGRALIVAQDGVMVSAEHIINNVPYGPLEASYGPLDGYIVNQDLELTPLPVIV